MMLEGESTTMLFLLLIAKLFVDLICLENLLVPFEYKDSVFL